ncbi:MAG: hypothetical protein J7J92_02535 [Candidatus Aenigmarchaeota archaeon]|nr:hypothetical protein [Candidatus Aenigmarchaeota archaeon]
MRTKLNIILTILAIILFSNSVLACITTEKTVSAFVDSPLDANEFKSALENLGFEPVLEELEGFSKISFVYGVIIGSYPIAGDEPAEFNVTISIYSKGEQTIFSIISLEEEYSEGEIDPEEQLKDVIKIAINKNALDFPLADVENLKMTQGYWGKHILICENFNDENPDRNCFDFTYKSACDGELQYSMPECLQDYCAVCKESGEYLETTYNKEMLGIPVPTCGEEINVEEFILIGTLGEQQTPEDEIEPKEEEPPIINQTPPQQDISPKQDESTETSDYSTYLIVGISLLILLTIIFLIIKKKNR